jgi:hypothetical protein
MNLGMRAVALAAAIVRQDPVSGDLLGYELTALASETQVQMLLSALGIGLIFLVRWALLGLVRAHVEDAATQYRWVKTSRYVALVLTVLVLALVWLTAIRSLGTFFGLLSAGLAIALKAMWSIAGSFSSRSWRSATGYRRTRARDV